MLGGVGGQVGWRWEGRVAGQKTLTKSGSLPENCSSRGWDEGFPGVRYRVSEEANQVRLPAGALRI